MAKKKSSRNIFNEFACDIRDNLQKWTPKGHSVFYLTEKSWYQLRRQGNAIHCFRQDRITHAVVRIEIIAKSLSIGKAWLEKPEQMAKRSSNFFNFLAH